MQYNGCELPVISNGWLVKVIDGVTLLLHVLITDIAIIINLIRISDYTNC